MRRQTEKLFSTQPVDKVVFRIYVNPRIVRSIRAIESG